MIYFMLSLIIEKETQTFQVISHTYTIKTHEQRTASKYHILRDRNLQLHEKIEFENAYEV